MRYAIQNKANPSLFWTDDNLETGKAGWVEFGFDIYDNPVNPKRLPENGINISAHDFRIPDKIMKGAAEYIHGLTGLRFTDDEIQMIARQADITLDIIAGGEFATGEREMFQDALAQLFVLGPYHWPHYGGLDLETAPQGFATKLMQGIDEWRDAGHKFRSKAEEAEQLPPLDRAKILIREVLANLEAGEIEENESRKLREALELMDS